MKRILITLIILNSAACSLLKGKEQALSITSNPPEAEISYLTKNKEYKVLGKTPFSLSPADLKIINDENSQFAAFQIKKSGHAIETLLLDLRSSRSVEYFASLKPIDVWNNKEQEISSAAANSLARKIQQINHHVLKRDHVSALSRTEALIQQFPKASSFYDMRGSILLLMGKKSEAISSYEKSLSINPDNSEAKKVLHLLETGAL